jgi:sugar lactone lactonase YvrE
VPRRPSISPVVWHPPASQGQAKVSCGNGSLPDVRLLPVNGLGPEDVLLDGEGRILAGVHGGRILRVSPDGRQVTEVADTGARPLGLAWLPDGRLLVCDGYRGLLAIDLTSSSGSGSEEVLADSVDGAPLRFCGHCTVASDGTAYFTSPSDRFGFHHWKADLMEHSGTGRLLRRSPSGEVDVVLDGLQFANGVALTPDEDAVIVAEMGSFALTRYSLADGARSTLAQNLPGYPYNVSLGTDGLLWVAIASSRNRTLDLLARTPPVLRKAVWALPEQLHPTPQPAVWVLALDPSTGTVVHDLHGPAEHEFSIVTSVREHHGTLYLGSVVARAVATLALRAP